MPERSSATKYLKIMLSAICALLLRLWGWEIVGDSPRHLKKYVIIVIPHTSNWDFPLGILLRRAMNETFNYVGKSALFRFPFGWFFRWMGGVPVDRSKRTNFVDAIIDIYKEREHFKLTIAPEGTRSPVDELKTGFYYIAIGAKVPIVMVKFDYGPRLKQVVFSEPLYMSGNKAEDFAKIENYFQGTKGKIHKNAWSKLR